MRLLKTIKRIAAIGTSGALIGATLGGAAFAQTLGEYPAPFLEGGAVNKLALVIGDAADVDSAAANDVSLGLQGGVTETGGVVVTGGVTEEIPLGLSVASDGSTITGTRTRGNVDVFNTDFEESELDHLFDGQVTYRSKEYDTSEVFIISAGDGEVVNRTMKLHTSLSSSDDDYESNILLEVQKDTLKYYYSFDEAINLTNVNSDNTLEISFLGKKLEITDIAWGTETNPGTEFTANVGSEYHLSVDESVTVTGKIVTLKEVSSSSAIVDVDGVTEVISSGNTETVNGVEVKVKDVFNRDKREESSAVLIVGEDASETYKDEDAYVGEDDDSPDWVWNIAGLDTTAGSTTTLINNNTNGITETGIILGIENDFQRDDDKDNPVALGECYNLPNNFLSVCFESLTVDDDDYMPLTVEFETGIDFDSALGTTSTFSSEPAIWIHTDGDYIVLDQSDLDVVNGTAQDRDTGDLYVYSKGGEVATDTEFIWVFWKDENNKMQYAGNITNQSDTQLLAHLDYKSLSGNDVRIFVEANETEGDAGSAAGTGVNITVMPIDSQDLADPIDNITAFFATSSGKFNSLGATVSSEEAGELFWFNIAGGQTIGTKDEDHRTLFGMIVNNPKSQGAGDKVVLDIPGDIVKGNLRVSGEVVSGGEGGIPSVMTASEVADLTAWNAILVGGPCVNSHTATVLGLNFPACGTDSKITPDTAIVELKANGDNWAMVVAGWELEDTRRAGIVMRNWEDFAAQLAGKSAVTVTGTSLEVSGITVE